MPSGPDIVKAFAYSAPAAGDAERYARLTEAAFNLAKAIVADTPACMDQATALYHARNALLWANNALALKGAV